MPTIKENWIYWDIMYNWKEASDEWSRPWGGVDMEWYFTILPRIKNFIPIDTILEIGPGYGRWTQFLTKLCKKLILVDLSEKCIQACKERFKEYSHITYFINDGKSLEMIPSETIDFVFSFDSLVHAEEKVIEAYLHQIAKKLKQNGGGFIHHSNIGAYKAHFSMNNKIRRQPKLYQAHSKLRVIDSFDHLRAHSMTASKFRNFLEKAGLRCISQELINWRTKRLIDCISVFTKKDFGESVQAKIMKNRDFTKEIELIKRLSVLYGEKSS